MYCPRCGSDNIRVIEKIPQKDGSVKRYRKCKKCNRNFKTFERLVNEK